MAIYAILSVAVCHGFSTEILRARAYVCVCVSVSVNINACGCVCAPYIPFGHDKTEKDYV